MGPKENKYHLKPCAGDEKSGVKTGHVYKVINPKGDKERYMSLEDAKKRFGIENLLIDNSHTICPDCNKLKIRRI